MLALAATGLVVGIVDAPIKLDGYLTDTAWQATPAKTAFFEVYPGNVAPPRFRTEARFLADGRNIYVGIRAFDPQPASIRSSLTRRDQITADEDYVEILVDPLNTAQSAVVLRTNPDGIQTDGVYTEDSAIRNLLPDFDFDVRTSIDAEGWAAEYRIPLSTLRHAVGPDQSWSVVIYRNVPRRISETIASVPVPRGASCVLCYAEKVGGISISTRPSSLSLVPHITYTHAAEPNAHQFQTGLDAKWQVRPDTSIDFTIAPDFAQVEADALQLVANARFALSVTEKRPFFLEGADLLSTPIPAIYTRSFADPSAGLRLTHRGTATEYTALLLRDKGGGTLIEPGAKASRSIPNDAESTNFVGRYRLLRSSTAWGAVASVRSYGEGGANAVLGLDTSWAPSTSDRFTGQVLWSHTKTPNQPDPVKTWDGRSLAGAAAYASWKHTADAWYTTAIFRNYSHDFRSWNGFLTQAGISRISVTSGLYFYPQSRYITRISPLLTISDTDETGGERVSRAISPGFAINGPRDTAISFNWSPRSQDTSAVGLRSYSSWSASVISTPVEWMPNVRLTIDAGETLDFSTGSVGRGQVVEAEIPLRLFGRLELAPALSYQSLNTNTSAGSHRVFTERNLQVDALWHFSNRLYAHALFQNALLTTAREDGSGDQSLSSTHRLFLLSYQANWQTRYFVGFRDGLQGREVFGKLSYVFSR
jgi:Domain of unknown function (DUF5916)